MSAGVLAHSGHIQKLNALIARANDMGANEMDDSSGRDSSGHGPAKLNEIINRKRACPQPGLETICASKNDFVDDLDGNRRTTAAATEDNDDKRLALLSATIAFNAITRTSNLHEAAMVAQHAAALIESKISDAQTAKHANGRGQLPRDQAAGERQPKQARLGVPPVLGVPPSGGVLRDLDQRSFDALAANKETHTAAWQATKQGNLPVPPEGMLSSD